MSVERSEKYYASHLKDRADTTAINVRHRQRRPPAGKSQAYEPAKIELGSLSHPGYTYTHAGVAELVDAPDLNV